MFTCFRCGRSLSSSNTITVEDGLRLCVNCYQICYGKEYFYEQDELEPSLSLDKSNKFSKLVIAQKGK